MIFYYLWARKSQIEMHRYFFMACVAIGLLGFTSCRQQATAKQETPATDVPDEISESFNQASPEEVAALLKKSANLKQVDIQACSLLDATMVAGILGVDSSGITEDPAYHQPNKSTCIWTWNEGNETLAVRIEFNDYMERLPNRYANYFKQLIEEGEWAEPMGLPEGAYKYEAVKGPGDESLWSAPLRSLKCRLGNSYCLFASISHQGEEYPVAAQDLTALRKLAGEVTRKLAAQQN